MLLCWPALQHINQAVLQRNHFSSKSNLRGISASIPTEKKKRAFAHNTWTKSKLRQLFSHSSMLKYNLKVYSKQSNISSSDYSYWWKVEICRLPQQPDKQLPIQNTWEAQSAETLILSIDSTQAKCRKLISHVSLSNCVYSPILPLVHWTKRTQEVASFRAD